ncbi:MAG TPA: cysteine hydrolase [Leptospiraceae bacterium]|nr:N-carbamoylsarcosine amidase [Spirochaetaceae bacterium]HBS05520.1 cysteine hydrolase [Leptospiraceae bacterium]|tara:strand:- start:5568 stop:6341 length:774 start_codon:yes stop_codon:yes gene_type:complete
MTKHAHEPTNEQLEEIIQDLDPEYIDVDPLKKSYTQSIIQNEERYASIKEQNTALMVIDMQYLDAAPGYGVFADPKTSGVPPEAQEYYFSTLENIVIPNVQRLLRTFRSRGFEVIHTRIMSLTKDGRDRSPGHKRLKLHAAPGSKEAEFLDEVKPVGDEIVLNKTASGCFTSTNINYLLKNLDIQGLFITGVYTNECVSTTVRDASDLGYLVTLISDACTTVTQELQDSTVFTLQDRYARVIDTDTAIQEIEQYASR